jgi:hypothetical protein
MICFQMAMLPIQLGVTFGALFLKFELAGSGVTALSRCNGRFSRFIFEKSAPNGHHCQQSAVTPYQQNYLQRA